VLGIALVALAACASDSPGATTSPVSATGGASETSGVAPAASVPVTTFTEAERIRITDPDWMAADDQHVYVKLDTGHVLRLDPQSGLTLGDTDIGGELCQGIGAAFGSVWSCRGLDDGDAIVRIDPATDQVVATIDVRKARMQGNLAGGFDRLWVLSADGAQLVGIDPATNEPDEPIDLGVVGADLSVGPDGVWVVSSRDRALVRVDPATRTVTGRIDGLPDPVAVNASAGVWVASLDSLSRIDQGTLSVADTVPVGTGPTGGITVGEGDVWIRREDQFLVRVDAATGEVVERYDEPAISAGSVLVAFGSVWATAYDDGLLIRHELAG
jgi:YVTN family beta-propeller protein